MNLVDLTNDNFDELTEKHALVLLDFWAQWCGPCHQFAPVYEAASKQHPDILFARINTETEVDLAKQFEIFSIPTLISSKDGTIVYARPGAISPAKLEKLIAELRRA